MEQEIISTVIAGGIFVLVGMVYRQGNRIERLEGKMDVTCDSVSKLLDKTLEK